MFNVCPGCMGSPKGWSAPAGNYAMEKRNALLEHGINPDTGHNIDCPFADLRV